MAENEKSCMDKRHAAFLSIRLPDFLHAYLPDADATGNDAQQPPNDYDPEMQKHAAVHRDPCITLTIMIPGRTGFTVLHGAFAAALCPDCLFIRILHTIGIARQMTVIDLSIEPKVRRTDLFRFIAAQFGDAADLHNVGHSHRTVLKTVLQLVLYFSSV